MSQGTSSPTLRPSDPLHQLPYETWLHCMKFTVEESAAGPLPYLAVSSEWSATIIDSPSLWTSIVLDNGEDEAARVQVFIQLSKQQLVDIIYVNSTDGSILHYVLRECASRVSSIVYTPRPTSLTNKDKFLMILNEITSEFPALTTLIGVCNVGLDWFAMYNPRLPGGQKSLDITLIHQLNHESVVCCVRFSKDGRFLATGCNRSAQIFDMRSGALVCRLEDESVRGKGDIYIRSVCFSPDGKYLATGAEDRQIRIWDIKSRKIHHLFEGHKQEIYSLDFSSTGHLIVSGGQDETARIWNMDNGTSTVLSLSGPAQPPSSGAANPSTSSSGSAVIPGGNGVKEGDGDTQMTEAAVGPDAGVTSVAISPDGRLVAAGSLDTIVRLWDVTTGTLLERLRGHRDSVYSVAFTPDGRGLVSGSLDKTLKYWELNSSALRNLAENGPKSLSGGEKYAKCQFNFVGHEDYVLSVAISHDGQWVVSGSKDRGVQFWDKNGVAQLMLHGHSNSVISVDLSPTGGHLATGSGDWQARVWGYTPLQPLRD